MTLLANGIDSERMPLDDAEDVAQQLVAMGRAIPPAKWVTSLKRRAADRRADGLPHNLV